MTIAKSPSSLTSIPNKKVLQKYSWEDVRRRDATRTDGEAWTVINGIVYDLTHFAKKHPGGPVLLASAGKDGTPLYEIHHPFSNTADKLLEGLAIGVLDDPDHYPRSALYREIIERLKKTGVKRIADLRDDASMMCKATVLLTLWVLTYWLAWFSPWSPSTWGIVAHCTVVAFIGMLIMHDGNHQGSNHRWFNTLCGQLMSCIGGSSHQWTFSHIQHHAVPNQPDDPDTFQSLTFLRYRPDQPFLWHMKYQHIYAWFLYTLAFVNKQIQAIRNAFNPTDFDGIILPAPTWGAHLWNIFGVFFSLTTNWVVPCYLFGFAAWFPRFFLAQMVGSIILASVFQCNHITIDTELRPGNERAPKTDWAVDQILGTNNFTQGKHDSFLGWVTKNLTGGLGYQVEHHMFPTASHTMLHKVHDVLRPLCEERRIRLVVHDSLYKAMRSHHRLLVEMGPAHYRRLQQEKRR